MRRISQAVVTVVTFLSLAVCAGTAAAQDKPQDKPKDTTSVSQQDKLDACKKLADKKGLTGKDRKSFIKDCMNKANSK